MRRGSIADRAAGLQDRGPRTGDHRADHLAQAHLDHSDFLATELCGLRIELGGRQREALNVAGPCLEFWMLVRLASEAPSAPEATAWQAHVTRCARCQAELDGIRATASQLAALGAAEHDRAEAAVVGTWNRIRLATERPALATRLPIRVAGLARDLASVTHPALAGATVAMIAGLAAGTWLAVTIDRGPTTDAAASQIYDASNLLDAASTGLATRYFDTNDAAVSSNADAMPMTSTPATTTLATSTPATTTPATSTPATGTSATSSRPPAAPSAPTVTADDSAPGGRP